MSLFSLILVTYLGIATLTCNLQPLPQPPIDIAEQSTLTCLIELENEAGKRFYLFRGWLFEVKQWGGDVGEVY